VLEHIYEMSDINLMSINVYHKLDKHEKSKVCKKKKTYSPSHKQTHTMNMSGHAHTKKQAYIHLHNRQTRIASDRKKQICTSHKGNNTISAPAPGTVVLL